MTRFCISQRVACRIAALAASVVLFSGLAVRSPWAEDLVDLIAQRKVEVQIAGAGIREVTIRLHQIATQSQPIQVVIPVGTFFVANNRASQNMVSISLRSTELASNSWITLTVPAACANKPKNVPNQEDRFSVTRAPRQAELVIAVKALDAAHASYPIIQAAVWIITDNATYDGMGILVRRSVSAPPGSGNRVIDADDAARAMKILAESGVNIRQKAIWRQDRARLAQSVTDKPLADWLKSK